MSAPASPKALDMLDVGYPDIDWCRLAAGVGVSASRIRTIEEFAG
jgi:acetolactate synthase-1/2/3 large subunit